MTRRNLNAIVCRIFRHEWRSSGLLYRTCLRCGGTERVWG